jgi:hypothetical protein
MLREMGSFQIPVLRWSSIAYERVEFMAAVLEAATNAGFSEHVIESIPTVRVWLAQHAPSTGMAGVRRE